MMTKITPLIMILVGGYAVYKGSFEYGLWVNKGPGGGFLPAVMGVLLILASLILLMKKEAKVAYQRKNFAPVFAVFIVLLFIKYLGMMIACGLFIVAWLKYLEQYSLGRASAIGIGTTVAIYLVFKVWLNVPLPTGVLGT
ncbi:tripartite tricarboxylate transporter TctB family protein [Ammoniphilus sp. YIM 78166]|uniref:tripartite tricarboxylate transporter TctB family protein n=1 Tax=Ammoniphilus sp. YIM 78166 TaxID=1644106 RepID=UPI00106F21DA|nr:tripartite tricarboxylate transporter TctB family protein [Ammoniphilus sp. YIM 78166]